MAKPTQADAEAAVRVLIEWAGDDPSREGLIEECARLRREGKDAEERGYRRGVVDGYNCRALMGLQQQAINQVSQSRRLLHSGLGLELWR